MVKLVLGYLFAATTIASPLVRRVTIGHATIELEETTFAAAAKRLGNAPIVQTGDAGGSRAQACYATVGTRPTRYYLESSEMGGGDRITRVDVVSSGSATAAEEHIIATRCTPLARSAPAARTDRGIMLGLSRQAVDRRLRLHGRDSAGVTLYEKSEYQGTGTKVYNVSSWFRVRYMRGRVTAFSTGVVSSN
jgi:hypothetical protein